MELIRGGTFAQRRRHQGWMLSLKLGGALSHRSFSFDMRIWFELPAKHDYRKLARLTAGLCLYKMFLIPT